MLIGVALVERPGRGLKQVGTMRGTSQVGVALVERPGRGLKRGRLTRFAGRSQCRPGRKTGARIETGLAART